LLAKSIFIVPIAVVLLAQQGAQDAEKKERELLQGTWAMAALEVDGKDVGVDKVQGTVLTIKGDRYSVKTQKTEISCVIRLDPKKDPPTIDMVFTDPATGEKTHKGIYKFKGDTLQICRGLGAEQPRPDQLATWPNTGYFVVTWKRQP
jgi:uncharacterized protein (TIGR03067 family)